MRTLHSRFQGTLSGFSLVQVGDRNRIRHNGTARMAGASGKKASRIRVLHGFQFADATTWEAAFRWLTETTSRFKRVFAKDGKDGAANKRLKEPHRAHVLSKC